MLMIRFTVGGKSNMKLDTSLGFGRNDGICTKQGSKVINEKCFLSVVFSVSVNIPLSPTVRTGVFLLLICQC